VPLSVQIYLFIMSLEESSCPFFIGATYVGLGDSVCRWWLFFSLASLEITNWPSLLLYFNFSLYSFDFLSWSFCRSFICFQYHPPILIYQILYSLIWPSLFGFLFFSWSFCKSLSGFQFYPSIQINGIIFFNLVLVVLISNFFSWSFRKSYYSFQFHPLITKLFLFFMSIFPHSFDFFFSISPFN